MYIGLNQKFLKPLLLQMPSLVSHCNATPGPFVQSMSSSTSFIMSFLLNHTIGAMVGPRQAGSAYVLLHHIMGEAAGRKGVWAYIEGWYTSS